MPPWFEAVHVPVHVTVQVAPDWQVTLVPCPAVTVQWLPDSHDTLAEAPAVSVHVACPPHWRFALSAAAMTQLLCELHCVSHEAPQAPEQLEPDSQVNLHPEVCAVQAPVPLRLQAPAAVQVQLVPVQAAGTAGPVLLVEVELPPQAAASDRARTARSESGRTVKGCLRGREWSEKTRKRAILSLGRPGRVRQFQRSIPCAWAQCCRARSMSEARAVTSANALAHSGQVRARHCQRPTVVSYAHVPTAPPFIEAHSTSFRHLSLGVRQ